MHAAIHYILFCAFSSNQRVECVLVTYFFSELIMEAKQNNKILPTEITNYNKKTSCSGAVSTQWHLCDQQTLKLSAPPAAWDPCPALKILPIQFNGMLPPSSLTICLCCSEAVLHFCSLIGQGTPQSSLQMGDHYLLPNSAASLSSDLINSNQRYSWSDGCKGLPVGGV